MANAASSKTSRLEARITPEQKALRLNPGQSQAFVEALLHPSEPNEALRQAADEYRAGVVAR